MPRRCSGRGVPNEGICTGRDFCIGTRLVRGALVNQSGVWAMTEYYKGERISELLKRINELQVVLDLNKDGIKTEQDFVEYVQGEASLAIMKAKLTALQGDGK